MSVGTFLQPDHETQSGAIYKAAIDNCIAVLARIGALFAAHEQDPPDMTIRLDPGALSIGTVLTEVAAQNTGAITAPTGTDHRIDRVVVDKMTGAVSVITGAPGALPRTAPAITAGKRPICQVAVAYDTTEITNDLITDERFSFNAEVESFPVNGVYLQRSYMDPATELGYGTWQELILTSPLLLPNSYPPAHNSTYVKATTEGVFGSTLMRAYNATNPAKLLTGNIQVNENAWVSSLGVSTQQRFHIDLGEAININRIYYEPFQTLGIYTDVGVKNFTFWGSNEESAFLELTYGTDTDWIPLATDITQMVQHAEIDEASPRYINVSNPVAYRYYAFKFADNWGNASWMGIVRIELQRKMLSWLRTA